MQELMRRFLMNAFDTRSAIFAGYNNSSLELARRLKKNPGMRLEVAGLLRRPQQRPARHGIGRAAHRSLGRSRRST